MREQLETFLCRVRDRDCPLPRFVERLQQTILPDHWWVESRRRSFTTLQWLEASLQSYLRFYDHERAHHGYRTRGRTPAQIVWGAQDEKA